MVQLFESIYQNLTTPVVVCEGDPQLSVRYANVSAQLLLSPSMRLKTVKTGEENPPLRQFIRFEREADADRVVQMLRDAGAIDHARLQIREENGSLVQVTIDGNAFKVEGEFYFALFIVDKKSTSRGNSSSSVDVMNAILNASYHTGDPDAAINTVLSIAGDYVGVDRAYVFEDRPGNTISNTYEWCAKGVKPEIQNLQSIPKESFSFAETVGSAGAYVSDDVRTLPTEGDRELLIAQGIKSLAVLPMYHERESLGYMGFDDCTRYRKWSQNELQFLLSVASNVSSLINRRNAELKAKRSADVLQLVTDNTDSVIYVSDLDSYEIIFANKALSKEVGIPSEELIGMQCYKAIQRRDAPCPFCPIPHLRTDEDTIVTREWEYRNPVSGNWFFANDTLIAWIDGRFAHIETAVDITYRKQYEDQLHQYASTDSMTGTFNREWGYKLLGDAMMDGKRYRHPYSLCFLDLDGLKAANDRYGHAAGDDMIRQIIKTIRECVRSDDILCRWGGDEFLLLMRCSTENAQRVVNNIQNTLEKINKSGVNAYPLSVSVGITDFMAYDNIDDAVNQADSLMYENKMAKRKGKDRG